MSCYRSVRCIAEKDRWFSDKMYWQVADQPGKGGPDYLVMVDLEGKEVKDGLSSLNQEERKKKLHLDSPRGLQNHDGLVSGEIRVP